MVIQLYHLGERPISLREGHRFLMAPSYGMQVPVIKNEKMNNSIKFTEVKADAIDHTILSP
jgi:hypothetical protein